MIGNCIFNKNAELVLDLETYNSSLDSDGRSTYSAGQQTFSVEGQLMNNRSFWSFFKKIAKAVAVVSADAIGVCVGSTIHPAMGVAFCATASAGTSVLLDADINVSFLKESFGPDITRSNYGVWHNNTIAAYLNEHGSLTNLDPLQFYNYSLTYCSNNIGSSTSRPLPYEKVETLCSALAQLFTSLENDNSEKTEEEICNMIVSAVPEIRAQEVKILLNFLLKMYSHVKPSTFNDATFIADCIKAEKVVILNMDGMDNVLAQRIIDFASGVEIGRAHV